jgi:O-antigen/teichoic acid export membrane protein
MIFIRAFVARFRGSEFAKNTAVLTLGTVVAQGVAIAAMPILSRLYTPTDFGLLAVFLAVSGIVATAITLRYETAILLPKDECESKTLMLLSAALAVLLGVLIGLIAWLLPEAAKSVMGISVLNEWLVLAVLCGITTALMTTGSNWYNRQRAYIKMTTLRIIQGGTGALIGIALGLWDFSAGLMLAQIVASLIVAVIVIFSLRALRANWRNNDYRRVACKHSAAPKYLLPTALLDVVTLQLPVLLITAWFSSEAAGQFSMAWKILALPAALIGGAMSQVFFQKISSEIHLGIDVVRHRYIKVSKILGFVSLIPILLVSLYGAELFSFVLGKQWYESGQMAEWLIFSSMMYFVFSPTTSILLVLGKQKVLLIFSVIQLAYRLGIALISHDVMEYIRWLVMCEFINVILFELVVIYYLNPKPESKAC